MKSLKEKRRLADDRLVSIVNARRRMKREEWTNGVAKTTEEIKTENAMQCA
jgi:hypothetical protein